MPGPEESAAGRSTPTGPPVAAAPRALGGPRPATIPLAAWLLAALALAWFSYYRTRFVAACDPPAYLLESFRLRGVRSGLELDPSVPFPAARAPLGFLLHDGQVVSFFPLGYPLLLALAGPFGLELHVNPLLGAASALAIFVLVRHLASERIALAAMLAWLGSPLVFYGATQVMSDLTATAFALFSFVALPAAATATRRTRSEARSLLSGILFGIGIAVRPAQLVTLPVALTLAPRPRVLAGVAAGLALALGTAALALRASTGSFVPGYSSNLHELGGIAFLHQLAFFARELAAQHAPVVLLALAGAVLRPRPAFPFLLWIACNTLFHALWNPPLELWWEARFVLPSVAALVVLAGLGAAAIAERVPPHARRAGGALGALAVLGYALWSALASPAVELQTTHYHEDFAEEARVVGRAVPEGALVGANEASAPLRYYGHVESFHWCHPDAPALIAWSLAHGRPVYGLLEADPARFRCGVLDDPRMLDVHVERVRPLAPSGALYRIVRRGPVRRIDVGTAGARPLLGEGWGDDEGSGEDSFAWIVGPRARFTLPHDLPPGPVRLRLSLDPYPPVTPLRVELLAGGTELASVTLEDGPELATVPVPADLAGAVMEIVPARGLSPRDAGHSADPRPLSIAVRWIDVLPADDAPTAREVDR